MELTLARMMDRKLSSPIDYTILPTKKTHYLYLRSVIVDSTIRLINFSVLIRYPPKQAISLSQILSQLTFWEFVSAKSSNILAHPIVLLVKLFSSLLEINLTSNIRELLVVS